MSGTDKADAIPVRGRVPGWVLSHMERLHSGTNLEEMCSSPPEAGGFLRDLPGHPRVLPAQLRVEAPAEAQVARASLAELHPLRVPRNASLVLGPRDCGSGGESTHTTPSATPQSSPSLVRRILGADLGASTGCTGAPADGRRRPKKGCCAVSNFDINAVSPTSW